MVFAGCIVMTVNIISFLVFSLCLTSHSKNRIILLVALVFCSREPTEFIVKYGSVCICFEVRVNGV
jgi:hypothetical protein